MIKEYQKLLYNRTVVVWGAGRIFESWVKRNSDIKIDFLVDSDKTKWGTKVEGILVSSPELLKNQEGLVIIVCVKNSDEIVDSISAMKLKNISTLKYSMLDGDNGNIAFSLFAEDAMLKSYIEYMGKNKIKHYIDVGANCPIDGNSTYLFYLNGADGILVEPNVDMEGMLTTYRGRDKLMICGCASEREDGGVLEYYKIGKWHTRNTFSYERALEYEKDGFPIFKNEVPVYSLNNIVNNADYHIDYINIDAEGMEYDILKDFDFSRYKISYFMVEKLRVIEVRNMVYKLMIENGYKVIGESPSNWVFELSK